MDNDYTPQQRLQEVNKAIQAVLLGGQSYKIGSRSLTRADLALLRAHAGRSRSTDRQRGEQPPAGQHLRRVFRGEVTG